MSRACITKQVSLQGMLWHADKPYPLAKGPMGREIEREYIITTKGERDRDELPLILLFLFLSCVYLFFFYMHFKGFSKSQRIIRIHIVSAYTQTDRIVIRTMENRKLKALTAQRRRMNRK